MPFKSEAQRRFMYSQHPEIAKEFQEHTPANAHLPEHVKKMAEGGMIQDEPGIQDATVSDFLGPYLGGKAVSEILPEASKALEGLGEAGEITLGKAPEMGGEMGEMPKVVRFSKGVMGKGTPNEMTIWGVKGAPEEVAKLGFGTDPASIPEHILDKFGIPEEGPNFPSMNAPNSYAYGGETNPEHETVKAMENNPTAGFSKGGEVKVQDKKTGLSASAMPIPVAGMADGGDITNAALSLLGATGIPGVGDIPMIAQMNQAKQAMIPQPPPPNPNVDQGFIDKLNAGTAMTPMVTPSTQPQRPSLNDVSQSLRNTPPTDYSLFKGISAEDRANLYKQLLAQKASGANLAVKGVAGLGDAISNAFGRGGQNTLGNIRQTENENIQNQVGAIDTERQQKMQDIQGNIALQEADPNSPYSQGMRQFLTLQGMKVPSGMSAAMLKSTLPDVTKIFDAKVQAITAQGQHAVEAGKALYGETFADWLKQAMGFSGVEQGQAALEKATGNTPQSNNGGWSIVR